MATAGLDVAQLHFEEAVNFVKAANFLLTACLEGAANFVEVELLSV